MQKKTLRALWISSFTMVAVLPFSQATAQNKVNLSALKGDATLVCSSDNAEIGFMIEDKKLRLVIEKELKSPSANPSSHILLVGLHATTNPVKGDKESGISIAFFKQGKVWSVKQGSAANTVEVADFSKTVEEIKPEILFGDKVSRYQELAMAMMTEARKAAMTICAQDSPKVAIDQNLRTRWPRIRLDHKGLKPLLARLNAQANFLLELKP